MKHKLIKHRLVGIFRRLNIRQVILLGLLVRFIIIPITGHWDLTSLNIVASTLIKESFLSKNIYSYDIAIYPPFTYWLLGLWQIIIKPFVEQDFYTWLEQPTLYSFYNPHVFRYFFLLKIPHLVFDVGILILLLRFFTKEAEKKVAAVFWALNPVVLYATFAWGAVDVIPTFFLLLAVYLIKKNKAWVALAMLGIGGGFKLFPLMFIVPAAVISFKSWNRRILGTTVGLLPFIMGIAYYLDHQGFITYVLGSDRSNMIYHMSFYIGFQEYMYLFFVFYTILLFWIKDKDNGKLGKFWQYVLIILMFMFATSAFTPQWAVWAMPFLIIAFVKNESLRRQYLWLFVGYILIILTFNQHLSLGLLSPIEPAFLEIPAFDALVGRFTQEPVKIWGLFRSFFTGTVVWFSYNWWRSKHA